MKIILAPDKFKGNMSSPEVCSVLRQAIQEELPEVQIVSLPLADGGEGTVDAIVAARHGSFRGVRVRGPLGKTVNAVIGMYGQGRNAVLEMSSASGLALLKGETLNPLRADTFGTGELIAAALELGVESLTIGLGGSATVDGGTGMARALGYRFLDADGKELPPGPEHLVRLDKISTQDADRRLFHTRIFAACDVASPLLGPYGAAAVYGPQKGATPDMTATLEAALTRLAEVWKRQGMLDDAKPGDGAAGGLGAGLRAFCGAEPVSGARFVIDITGLEKQLDGAGLVITGEGCTDSQTAAGKLCAEVAETARRRHVPVLLLSGALKGDFADFTKRFDYAFSASTGGHVCTEDAVKAGKADLAFTARQLARLIKIGGLQS